MARKRRDLLAARDLYTLLAMLAFIALAVLFRRFSFDDAYIAYRHALHLGQGLGPVMNPGERVEGVSNLPWTGLLGLFAAVDLEPHTVAPVLSFVCGLVLVGFVAALGARLIDDARAGGTAALCLAAAAPLAVWSVSGMETLAYTLVLTGLFFRAHSDRAHGRAGWGTGLLLGTAAILRPEGIAYAGAVWLLGARAWRWLGGVAAGALLVVMPVLLFRQLYYGAWLPNPVHTKAAWGTAVLASGTVYVVKMLVASPAHTAATLWLPRGGLTPRARRLLWGWVVTQVVVAAASGGERVPGYRFLMPALPAMAIAIEIALRRVRVPSFALAPRWGSASAVLLLASVVVVLFPRLLLPLANALLDWTRSQSDATAHAARLVSETRFAALALGALAAVVFVALRQRHALAEVEHVEGSRSTRAALGRPLHESRAARRAMAVTFACTLIVVLLPLAFDPTLRAARQPDPAVRFGRPVGIWLAESFAATTRVATNCAGSLPYFSRLPVIDMLGLTDAHISRVTPDRSQWTGHEKGDAAYVLSRQPDLVILGGPEGSETPWSFPGDQQLAASAEFRSDYEPRRAAIEDFEFVYYARRVSSGAAPEGEAAATASPSPRRGSR